MPFIPHTQADVDDMLAEIGVPDIDSLFDEIPIELTSDRLDHVPEGMSELAMLQHMAERAEQDQGYTCFLGGGSYDHHIPSAVWDLTTRGEFMTAYTPYQAEASQGTLQLIYEYQSMMVALTGMDVSNASVYDGAIGTPKGCPSPQTISAPFSPHSLGGLSTPKDIGLTTAITKVFCS